MLQAIWHAIEMSFFMVWKILSTLIFGSGLYAIIRVVVSIEETARFAL